MQKPAFAAAQVQNSCRVAAFESGDHRTKPLLVEADVFFDGLFFLCVSFGNKIRVRLAFVCQLSESVIHKTALMFEIAARDGFTFGVRPQPTFTVAHQLRDFIVTDEQHYMEYDKDKKDILLETVNEDGLTYNDLGSTAPGGWAYEYGKGRVCYFSPGHLITVLWNPEYVKLQHNAIRWLLRQG